MYYVTMQCLNEFYRRCLYMCEILISYKALMGLLYSELCRLCVLCPLARPLHTSSRLLSAGLTVRVGKCARIIDTVTRPYPTLYTRLWCRRNPRANHVTFSRLLSYNTPYYYLQRFGRLLHFSSSGQRNRTFGGYLTWVIDNQFNVFFSFSA